MGVVIGAAAVLMRAFNNTADSTLALLFAACALVIFDGQRIRPSVQSLLVGVIQGLACGFRQTVLVSAVVSSRALAPDNTLGLTPPASCWSGTVDCPALRYRNSP